MMVKQSGLAKPKRPSKGQRLHVRRLKQAARKEANPNTPQSTPVQPVRKKQSEPL